MTEPLAQITWLIGCRTRPYSSDWWQYVDIDAAEQAKAIA